MALVTAKYLLVFRISFRTLCSFVCVIYSIYGFCRGYTCLRMIYRLQNSPYFCVFKYARAVKRGWKQRARLGRDAKNTRASHALRACEARALRARKTLTPRFTDFFTDFEKKTDCFAVYMIYKQRSLIILCISSRNFFSSSQRVIVLRSK